MLKTKKTEVHPFRKNGVMINAFNFICKALFVFKIFKFLSQPFDYVGKATS